MAIHDLKEQIARLPEQPGVYLYANAAGETIYVGKARSLRDRVRSYLGASGASPKTDALLDEIASVAVIVTDSVMEALALENNLIKQRSPRYNILLRDDKNYPYLQLTTGEAFPRVLVARAVERDGHFYAGPFLPAKLARRTMGLTHKLFGLRSCNEVITGQRGRPCLEYDIKRCLAPCVAALCSRERYGQAVEDTRLFLEGRNQELADQLHARMMEAAGGERFEEAAALRDAMRTVQTIRERQQKMASPEFGDRDVFGVKVGPSGAIVQVFQVRSGRVVERIEFVAEAGTDTGEEKNVIEAAIQQFYSAQAPPPDVHVPALPEEAEAIESWLSGLAGRKVRVSVPQRGDKRGLLDLVHRNAELAYRARFDAEGTAQYEALELIQAALRLPELPRRIECFDISTIQGAETVASMVVCEDGRMKKGEYRKFRVGSREPGTGSRTDPGSGPTPDSRSPDSRQVSGRLRGHGAGRAASIHAGARSGRPLPGPHRHRWRQRAAERGVCRPREHRAVEPRRDRIGQEGRAGLHARSGSAAGARPAWDRAAAAAADS